MRNLGLYEQNENPEKKEHEKAEHEKAELISKELKELTEIDENTFYSFISRINNLDESELNNFSPVDLASNNIFNTKFKKTTETKKEIKLDIADFILFLQEIQLLHKLVVVIKIKQLRQETISEQYKTKLKTRYNSQESELKGNIQLVKNHIDLKRYENILDSASELIGKLEI